jgi:hypothetical protein
MFATVSIVIKCEAYSLHRKQYAHGRNIFCLQSTLFQKHEPSLELNNGLEIVKNVYEGKEREKAVENIYPSARPEGVCRSGDIVPPTHSHGTGRKWVLIFMS